MQYKVETAKKAGKLTRRFKRPCRKQTKAKDWINIQCEALETCLNENNSKNGPVVFCDCSKYG